MMHDQTLMLCYHQPVTKKPRSSLKTLRLILFIFGISCLLLALFVAHTGPFLLDTAFAALISGAIISAIADW